MNPITTVFYTRSDFDVVETLDATMFIPFVGEKTPAHGEASQTNPHWKLVHWICFIGCRCLLLDHNKSYYGQRLWLINIFVLPRSISVKFSLERSFLTFINCWQTFLWLNPTRWQTGFNIRIINFNSNLVDNFAKGFFKLIIRDWGEYTHHLHTFSPRILGICPALPFHVNEAIVELAINILSYSKVRFMLLKTSIKFTYLISRLRIWRFHFILHFKHHCC